ncbi:MAG TPA: hypothetical protein VK749_09920, partial [Xanthobacteraceae bacterium]|nr:hypothetical protein [Xanthobacteraceae bacterium]
ARFGESPRRFGWLSALYSLLYSGAKSFLEDEKKFTLLHCTRVNAATMRINSAYPETPAQSRVEFDRRH